MRPSWFKPRRYRHFDLPVNEGFAQKVQSPIFVSKHSFSPLIHYEKSEKKYKINIKDGKRHIEVKKRPIKYSSHRDACILSYYAYLLNGKLCQFYDAHGISDSVIAYRALGRGNYNFSAEVMRFAANNAPVAILAFDVTGFFDNLDHKILKARLKAALSVSQLPEDWYKVFKYISDFHYVDISELKSNPIFSERLKDRSLGRISSVRELKDAGIKIYPNPEIVKGHARGIPQGTPISAVLSNVYMMEFDVRMAEFCAGISALYRRYSDDILIVCSPEKVGAVEAIVRDLLAGAKLEIAAHKTERSVFSGVGSAPSGQKAAQYLGFNLYEDGAAIRPSSLSRQWRKMKRAIRRARVSAEWRKKEGMSAKVFTKKLRGRFSKIEFTKGGEKFIKRNFSSYGRRSAAAFGPGEKISRQIKRYERAADLEISKLKLDFPSPP